MSGTSWIARAVMVDGVFAPVLAVVAAAGTHFGVWGFQVGLLLLVGAALIAVFGVLGALIALFIARKPGREGDRRPALTGLGLCAAVLGVVLFYALPGFKVPPIHDISTDVREPPQFSAALMAARGEGANPLARTAEIDAQQQAAYEGLAPLLVDESVATAHDRALGVARGLGWEIVDESAADGRIEATATTRWMGFKDDIAIRVRATESGAAIDLRSVSRVGVGDAGANAARIRAFVAAFNGAAAAD